MIRRIVFEGTEFAGYTQFQLTRDQRNRNEESIKMYVGLHWLEVNSGSTFRR